MRGQGSTRGPAAAIGDDARVRGVAESSRLRADPERVWRHATSFDGINYELMPLMRMTAPKRLRTLDPEDVVLGERLFRSWILLGGLVPFEYDDLTLVELEPGRRFLERSPMLSMALWEHERVIEPDGAGARVTDNVRFEPKLRWAAAAAARVVGFQFRHRHRRLRRLFGGEPAPARAAQSSRSSQEE